jgi:hypothetical protein
VPWFRPGGFSLCRLVRARYVAPLLVLLVGCSAPAVVPSTPAPSPTPTAVQGIVAGMHKVGVDVEPGEYAADVAADAPVGVCTWVRLSSSNSSDPDSVIASQSSPGPSYVTIEPGDAYFQTWGCTPWEKV